jgi:hypothetical protein
MQAVQFETGEEKSMRLLMMSMAMTLAVATPLLAQTSSQGPNGASAATGPADKLGNGMARPLDSGISNQTGNSTAIDETRTNMARAGQPYSGSTMSPPGTVPKIGTDRPLGTSGLPRYGNTPGARPNSNGD